MLVYIVLISYSTKAVNLVPRAKFGAFIRRARARSISRAFDPAHCEE